MINNTTETGKLYYLLCRDGRVFAKWSTKMRPCDYQYIIQKGRAIDERDKREQCREWRSKNDPNYKDPHRFTAAQVTCTTDDEKSDMYIYLLDYMRSRYSKQFKNDLKGWELIEQDKQSELIDKFIVGQMEYLRKDEVIVPTRLNVSCDEVYLECKITKFINM